METWKLLVVALLVVWVLKLMFFSPSPSVGNGEDARVDRDYRDQQENDDQLLQQMIDDEDDARYMHAHDHQS